MSSKVVLETRPRPRTSENAGKMLNARGEGLQEQRETQGEGEAILRRWRGERRSCWRRKGDGRSERERQAMQRRKTGRTSLGAAGSGKSSDGPAKHTKAERWARWGAVALPLARPGAGYLYAKADSTRRQYEKPILRAKSELEGEQ